jgi:hypothetical protein
MLEVLGSIFCLREKRQSYESIGSQQIECDRAIAGMGEDMSKGRPGRHGESFGECGTGGHPGILLYPQPECCRALTGSLVQPVAVHLRRRGLVRPDGRPARR